MPIEIRTHDSPLGRWTTAQWTPGHLSGLVDSLWYFEGFVALPRERIFPDGRADLIVHLGPRYGQVEGSRVERYSTVCLSGILLRSNLIEAPPGECAVLGVRLHPAGAYALLGRPLHDLSGITVDLADLAAPLDSAELAERCALASSPEGRLRAAAGWIAGRVARSSGADPAVAWTAAEIERHGGAVSISALRERTGWSKSRLAERFKEQIGVTPKVLARIVRFRRALVRLHRQGAEGAEGNLADLALRSGYYDQPHFNAEFRELAGFSPGEYLAASRYPESVSLAEPAA